MSVIQLGEEQTMTANTGQVALVTGASSGIGEAAARALHDAGFTVYGTSRKATPGETRRARDAEARCSACCQTRCRGSEAGPR